MKIQDAKDLLTALSVMKPSQRREFLRTATPKQIKILEEVFLNLLKNPRGLEKQHLAIAKRHSSKIKRMANYKIDPQNKRKILVQRGGFLSALLPILGTLVSTFLP